MRRAVLAGLAGCLCVAGALGASQAPAGGALKPLVPAAASSIAADPASYLGQTVTIYAAVDRIISPTAFTVDQDPKSTGTGDVLVLASSLSGELAPNQYVTVIGEVVRQADRPAIRATAVITASGLNLAKVQPPPMSDEEAAFDKSMKSIGPAFNSVRQAITNTGGEGAADQAATLVRGFEETEAFWKQRGPAETHRIASQARSDAAALQQAIKAGDWGAAKTAAGSLQQACSSCHGAHRERLDDGSYRIRMTTGREN